MENILRAENISGGYGKETVIKDVSLSLKAGDFLGIIGPNGSGKSTLLRLFTRVLIPRKGRVLLDGKEISRIPPKEISRKCAFVSQDSMASFSFTAWDIVLMGRIPHLGRLETETEKDLQIARQALSLTDALHLKDREMDELSAGERQRVVIAKALAQEPALLFLDEPTAHLDIGHQIKILDFLRKLNRENGLTIVIVLHDLNLASEYCGRILLLNEGRVFKEGSPDDVLTYQNLEEVYKTVLIVNKNPISSRPYVVLVSGENKRMLR